MLERRWSSFREALLACRIDAGFSPQELAQKAGVGVDTIYAWEKGTRKPRSHNVSALAKALGLEGQTRNAFMEFARRQPPQDAAATFTEPDQVFLSADTMQCSVAPELVSAEDVSMRGGQDASAQPFESGKRDAPLAQLLPDAQTAPEQPSLILGWSRWTMPLAAFLLSACMCIYRFISRGHTPRATAMRWAASVLLLISGSVAGVVGYKAYESRYLSPVITSVAGEVMCPQNEPVVGIYLRPDGGHGKFIDYSEVPGVPNTATFSNGFDRDVAVYVLSVGCGGTTQHWTHDDVLPPTPVDAGPVRIECADTPNLPGRDGTRRGSCVVKSLVQPTETSLAIVKNATNEGATG